jgi:predicted kinase
MFGVVPTQRLPAEAYASEVSARVYTQIFAGAARTAGAGWPVLADAVFNRAEDRAAIEAAARNAGAGFAGVWLDADLSRRIERAQARRNDASDATGAVLLGQTAPEAAALSWRRIDAGRPLAKVVAEIAEALGCE